ncbi:MAG: DUF1501 domain-containing protein [Pseudomonadota bacterium]
MTRPSSLTRRGMMLRSFALGCSVSASPLLTPVSFASLPGEGRLVVIILRGGMDGLDVVRPVGDVDFAALRPETDTPGFALDGFFELHPALGGLYPLWRSEELSFAHAVSTPYRDKRSHFDGQDMLETGGGGATPGRTRNGWLNRLVQTIPGATSDIAYAIGRENMLLLTGDAPVSNWSPEAAMSLNPQARRLLELVTHDDPLFREALAEALLLSSAERNDVVGAVSADPNGMMPSDRESRTPRRREAGVQAITRFAADRLRREARIAAFSVSGFDTHVRQTQALPRALSHVQDAILTLRRHLGQIWQHTAVLAMTEFGRTARFNGTGGTDHGTAGVVLMAGGALKGGRVITDWPGLSEADLYARRDLHPTRDLRALAGWVMHDLFGTAPSVITGSVFPAVDLDRNPRLLL